MLAPLVSELADMGVNFMGPEKVEPIRGQPEPGRLAMKEPGWVSIIKAAEEAPLKDLSAALAVYMNRVDEALAKKDN